MERLIYSYPQVTGSDDVDLQLYLGLGHLGGQLWEQEVKVLLRVGGLGHPALPAIVDGGYLEADGQLADAGMHDGLGYVRTRSAPSAIEHGGIAGMIGYLAERPAEALRHFWLLADALAILHDARIAHRNVWPGTLQLVAPSGEQPRLQLARFELSAMVNSLLHGRDPAAREQIRHLHRDQGPRALVYAPPERLQLLLGVPEAGGDLGGQEGDVFSLGMTVAEWFLGLYDDVSPVAPDESSVRDFQRSVRSRLNVTTAVPRELARLLVDMLDDTARGRPRMGEVLQRLGRLYDGSVTQFDERLAELPFLVVFQPRFTDRTLHAWGSIENPATSPEGREEVTALIRRDIAGAPVVVSQDGAVKYVPVGDEEDRRRATTVVFGADYVWFCEKYWRLRGFGTKQHFEQAQVVKYVLRRAEAGFDLLDLRARSPFARRLPMVDVVADDLGETAWRRELEGRPEWSLILEDAPEALPRRPKEVNFLRAVDWLMAYQWARLTSRCYAYSCEPSSTRSHATLRWDRTRDRDRANKLTAMESKYLSSERLRPGFADFFAAAGDDGSGRIMAQLLADDNGRPGAVTAVVPLAEVRGGDQVVVATARAERVPTVGWIRLAEDGPSRAALLRQAEARIELGDNRILLDQLIGGRSISGRRQRWEPLIRGTLEGEGRDAVLDVLSQETLFAVQGPPGTGKTEVSSEAVVTHLQREQITRVLVSAQSHDALDNLALRILRKLGVLDDRDRPIERDWVAVRIAQGQGRDRVDPRVAQFGIDEVTDRYVAGIEQRLTERLSSVVAHPERLELLRQWRDSVERTRFEMRRRLRRSANLVFATCGGATRRTLVDQGTAEPFDWVVVEEAAKAWPTELALPLVRGLRWTLVGDQAQIGAYARQDVYRFLESCQGDPDAEINAHWERRESYLEAFELFAGLFGPGRTKGTTRQLTEQYRMRPAIAEVVSRSFYPGGADDHDEAPSLEAGDLRVGTLITRRADLDHPVVEPRYLAGRALVWLDTRGVHQDRGFWDNETEAGVVARLVRSFRPGPRGHGPRQEGKGYGLAVLTPYRAQVDLLQRAMPEMAKDVWTIDSFQGREADVVVLSLVRDTPRANGSPLSSLGHLADAPRVNVALSRARDLLVIVGRFDHYATSGVPAWETVCRAVETFGTVVPVTEED